jgi:transcription antitermination factor NusB
VTADGADLRAAAEALAAAAREGADLQEFCRTGFGDLVGIEHLRPAGGLVMAANRDPGDGDEPLLLGDGPLRRVERVFHRDDALVALYQAEQGRAEPDPGALSDPARDLVTGVRSRGRSLDAAIGAAAHGWRVERMPPIDRIVLRMALWELRHRQGIPTGVIISEAVRLATAYSTERSGRFVNGVLSGLARDTRPTA